MDGCEYFCMRAYVCACLCACVGIEKVERCNTYKMLRSMAKISLGLARNGSHFSYGAFLIPASEVAATVRQ